MLVAPIFHNSYLSPSEPQSKQRDGSSSNSSSAKLGEASSSKYNNIFKSAFKQTLTFLSKITNTSGSNTPTSSSKAPESETNQDSSTPSSDCSSPDSLKTELIFFKPITREPKTPSSTKPVILRVPSIRSTASSSDRLVNSPCPSPFFIPITPRRESAFSFVNAAEENQADATTSSIIKPKATKRKYIRKSPQKPSKHVKRDEKLVEKFEKSEERPKPWKGKTETVVVRKTRSMDKTKDEYIAPTQVQMKAPVKKSLTSKAKKTLLEEASSFARVTRSRSLKHQ